MDVVFCQTQKLFNGGIRERWARLIVYDGEYADCLESGSPFLFMFREEWTIDSGKILVGISETRGFHETREEFEEYREWIEKLLKEEELKPQVILYTTAKRFREAFFNDYTESMRWNSKANNEERAVIYWSYCGEKDCALLLAVEDFVDCREGLDYFEEFVE